MFFAAPRISVWTKSARSELGSSPFMPSHVHSEIHSGEEHFVIRHFIRPQAVEPRPLQNPLQTLFYFPFDHPKFGASDAFDLIQSKLKSLGPRSFLFLHHVKELQWIVEGGSRGFYTTQP